MIGVDLGTTSSCVAVMEGGAPHVVPNQEGARTTPSVVAFTEGGERLVGEAARRQAVTNPRSTVFAVHRLIGRKFRSGVVEEARRLLPYQLVEAPNGDVLVLIGDRVYSTTEIVSFVLEKLKAVAEDYLGEPVEEAVITCPAYFNDCQRQAIKDAALIAGLRAGRIVNAPTAAAVAYGVGRGAKRGYLAVFDLGGGSFDVSILEMSDGLFQVRATGGDTDLGGEDFDRRVVDWLIAEFLRDSGLDLSQDDVALVRLKEAAENAKRELSSREQTDIALPFIAAGASGPQRLDAILTRRLFESLTEFPLRRTTEPCRRALADAGLGGDQIAEVLLVGGQTHDPRVPTIVGKLFGREPSRAPHPEEEVAMGAALLTGIIVGTVKDLVLLDVTPHTLGIETRDGTFTPLIERNSPIPTGKTRVFTTVADEQAKVEVHLLQGESERAAHNESLAKVELTGIPPAPRGRPQIEVGFEIDVNGIVSVSAQDQATGRSQSIVIHPSGGLSPAEVTRLAEATRLRQQAEWQKKEQEGVAQRLDGLLQNTMRNVQALEGKLTAAELERVLAAIERAQKARKGGDVARLKARLIDLEMAATLIGQAILRP